MIVSNALVTAEQGSIHGLPSCKVTNTNNLYIVGDWVGPEGLLSDASFSSAKQAAQLILNHRYLIKGQSQDLVLYNFITEVSSGAVLIHFQE